MDTLRLLDELKDLTIEQPRRVLGMPLFYGLDQEEINMQIAKVRASLPQDMKVAASTVRDTERIMVTAREDASQTLENARREAERIIAEAKQESDRILEQAKLKQEQMVNESEILKLSKAQSEEIRNAADRDATTMRRGADKYAFDVLSQLEGVVGKVMTTIERGKQEMQTPNPVPQALISREKTRV